MQDVIQKPHNMLCAESGMGSNPWAVLQVRLCCSWHHVFEGLMGTCMQPSSTIFCGNGVSIASCHLKQLPLRQACHALRDMPACRAIGIIFGDVGTSPLYVFASIFSEPPTHEDIMGTTSMIFWTLTLVALIK